MEESKIFYKPGDVVTLKQNIPNKPKMVVLRIERNIIKNDNNNQLLKGVKCRWFTNDGSIQEAIFSTKDLLLV